MNDLDEALGYDADHTDPSQFCRHGTFIGSWWGPDYLCGDCEAGTTDRDYIMGSLHQRIRHHRAAIHSIYPFVADDSLRFMQGTPYCHSVTVYLVELVLSNYDELVWRQHKIEITEALLAEYAAITDESFFTALVEA